MIVEAPPEQLGLPAIENFQTPFETALDPDNRWVRWAAAIPWPQLSAGYHDSLKAGGRPAKPARLVLGALIIKHKLKLSDIETIEQLRENPYLQYFCGLERYQLDAAFAPTLFVKIRERLTPARFAVFEQAVIDQLAVLEGKPSSTRPGVRTTHSTGPDAAAPSQDDPPPPDAGGPQADPLPTPDQPNSPDTPPVNAQTPAPPDGTLIIDASVAEQTIRYPNDISLLNEAREHSEQLLDQLWAQVKSLEQAPARKPRDYRRKARKAWLAYSKQRKPHARRRRAACRGQLQYLRRNLGYLDDLLDQWQAADPQAPFPLSAKDQRKLWIIRELDRQQRHMHQTRSNRIDDRLVSLHQPHVRPIVRGRAGHPVEFGAKFSASLSQGITCIDALRWDAFAEGGDLIGQCAAYRTRHGHYPAKVLADGVYGTRANRAWLKDHGIAFGGKALGRPPKRSVEQQRQYKRQLYQDACDRIPIEGKFGQGKHGYGLNKIPAQRADTSQAWIRAIFLMMNLLVLAEVLFGPILRRLWPGLQALWRVWASGDVVRADGALLSLDQRVCVRGF